ncbi:uncharacterized protein [Leptinotarsa decemlineata]|uniref:uncharacterized protein n=1 Tax=Leptinotarsa decemlineata TaxID=7539 RepID=UPI003D3084CE
MASYRGGSVCAYRGCDSKSRNRTTSLFRFPKDIERAKDWLRACNREDLLGKSSEALYGHYRLCELHFESNMFLNKSQLKKYLIPQAVPTVFAHNFKRKAGVLEEEAVKPVKVNILSDIQIVPPTSYLNQPSTSGQLSVGCGTFEMEESPCSNMSENLLIKVDEPEETPSCMMSPSAMTQTPASLSSQTPRKQKLRQIENMKKKNAAREALDTKKKFSLDDFDKICDQFLSQNLADIVKIQARLESTKAKRRRYTAEYKQFALTLYFLGPRAYNFFTKILHLPCKRSLQYITQKVVCRPGLQNETLFKSLEKKITTMLDQDKHCFLCVDEMALKSNLFYNTGSDEIVGLQDYGNGSKEFITANHATVIMIRGLYFNWKQPLAYFLVNETLRADDLKLIIEECIPKLTNIGFIIGAFVSDMGSNFIKLSKKLGVAPDNPVFMVGDKQILYLFDTPHVLKATRNNLLKNIIEFDGNRTSWSHIKYFYEQDKKLAFRCAPKLTDSHISPTNFEKMKVKLAKQIISNTVASGMNTYVSLGGLPPNAIYTAELIEKINNVFDILNASVKNSPNRFNNVFEGDKYQNEFLEDMIMFLKKLKVFNQEGKEITSNVKFITCWLITINGMKQLWEILKGDGFK